MFVYKHLLQNINNISYKLINLNKLTKVDDIILIIGEKVYNNGEIFDYTEKNKNTKKKYLLLGCSYIYETVKKELIKNKYLFNEYEFPETIIFEKI